MIYVSQPFLPPKNEYTQQISKLWDTKWLTNNGKFVQTLEKELKDYLHLDSLYFVSNGTSALEIAIRALDLKNEIITTPFSFVATTTSIIWDNCKPVFVDIHPKTLCIDPQKIEEAVTDKTEAILATHVFGIPCDIERIEQIAKKHNLKVIYDAAHTFGVTYNGKSLLSYGDISTISFHATKLYHTVEGGAVINNNDKELDKEIQLLRSFGFDGDQYILPGTNAKNSELHAAMGLCNLQYINQILKKYKQLYQRYDSHLLSCVQRPKIASGVKYNYSYYPIILKNENELLKVRNKLIENMIQTKRYFYPSLNNLPFINYKNHCPISEDISNRVLCLPLYSDLKFEEVDNISKLIYEEIG